MKIVKVSPRGTTRGITPTESYEIWAGDEFLCYVNKGDEAYFAVDENDKWLSTWYDTIVEAASAGINKVEMKKMFGAK